MQPQSEEIAVGHVTVTWGILWHGNGLLWHITQDVLLVQIWSRTSLIGLMVLVNSLKMMLVQLCHFELRMELQIIMQSKPAIACKQISMYIGPGAGQHTLTKFHTP